MSRRNPKDNIPILIGRNMKQHIHKFRRINIARKGNPPYWVLQCRLGDCNHYTPMKTKLSCPALIGKIVLCNKCSSPFEMDTRAVRMSEPVCVHCIDRKDKDKLNSAAKFFRDLENDEIGDGE